VNLRHGTEKDSRLFFAPKVCRGQHERTHARVEYRLNFKRTAPNLFIFRQQHPISFANRGQPFNVLLPGEMFVP
jgi:hypothetical protein